MEISTGTAPLETPHTGNFPHADGDVGENLLSINLGIGTGTVLPT